MTLRIAIILTHDRPEDIRRCVAGIAPQTNRLLVIDNASNPPLHPDAFPDLAVSVLHDKQQPPNLARLMNQGFLWARTLAQVEQALAWDVAMLCDDILVPEGWFAAVADAVRGVGAVAGSTHQINPVARPVVKTEPDRDIMHRMQGSAFVVRGEVGLQADERMHWWWQDTDLDWQARRAGGMVIAPGPVAHNTKPNDYTNRVPALAARAGLDQAEFKAKWGWVPW